jgi:phage baseplate assembly protein W
MIPESGNHLAFPFRIGRDGRTAQVADVESHVRDELIQLILTNLGERLFLPEFGAGARRLVFENTDEAARGVTKAIFTQAVTRWLGHRIEIESLTVGGVGERIEIEIVYRIAGTPDSRIMRFQRSSE